MSSTGIKTHPVEQELERRILYGLACEWKEALEVLDPSNAALMRRPLFSLALMKRKLGYWSREKREICLSREFVLNHGWDDVREVLRHEMAHQFAHEALGAHDEPPHGPKFHRACDLLRANPKASGSYRPLHERLFHESSSTADNIMLKIRKLMALTESPNRHEAELALAKARQLIAKYHVDLVSQEQQQNFVSFFLGKPALRHFKEDYNLSALLQDFYFVYPIWVSAYVLEKGKMGRVLEISGTLQNTKLAAYVHDFVGRFVDVQWSQYNQHTGFNRHRKTDFAAGIIKGFRVKLEAQRKAEDKTPHIRSLMKIQDGMLLKYAAYRYPYTRRVGRRGSAQNATIVNDGIRLGEKLVISKAITDLRRKDVPLLEHK